MSSDASRTVTGSTQKTDFFSCWNRLKTQLSPQKWEITSQKVAKYALILIAICAACIVISALMVEYPQASGAFFSLFGVALAVSVITLIIALVKSRQQPDSSTTTEEIPQENKPD